MARRDIIIRVEIDTDTIPYQKMELQDLIDFLSHHNFYFESVERSEWIKSDMIDYDVTILGSDSSFDRLET